MTAVEWLINALNKEIGLISFVPNADEEYKKELFNILEQAKEMEKSQIIEAFNLGQQEEAKQPFWTKGNEYYEKNF
jgi:hypothetical protein